MAFTRSPSGPPSAHSPACPSGQAPIALVDTPVATCPSGHAPTALADTPNATCPSIALADTPNATCPSIALVDTLVATCPSIALADTLVSTCSTTAIIDAPIATCSSTAIIDAAIATCPSGHPSTALVDTPVATCPSGHPPPPRASGPAARRRSPLAALLRSLPWTLLTLALAACRPPPAHNLPICPALVAADRAAEADTRQLPTDAWLAILLPGYDRTTHTLPESPRDCSRAPLTAPAGTHPPRPLTDDDLSFGTGDAPTALLVWARVLHAPDGTAFGPVALVHWTDRGLEIRGIGPLHAPARRVRLRLERIGDDQQLLVAEGETCPMGQDPPCPREAVIMPLRAQRFVDAPLVEGARPPRPARLRLDERRDFTGPGGVPRRLEIHRRLDLRGPTPEIRAAIRLRDCPTSDACSDHLSLDDTRPLELIDQSLVTPDDPWLTLLQTHTNP